MHMANTATVSKIVLRTWRHGGRKEIPGSVSLIIQKVNFGIMTIVNACKKLKFMDC